MRVVVIGCRDSSRVVMETVANTANIRLVGVVTRRTSHFLGDFVNLASLAGDYEWPVLYAEDVDRTYLEDWVLARQPHVVMCVGWSTLLSDKFINAVPGGVVGYHPAPLPRGRGRHPIVWTLALGLRETASSLFFMDGGADSGPILSQRPVQVSMDDDAACLYTNLLAILREQLKQVITDLRDNVAAPKPQRENMATYWRKRTQADGRIDWRMSAEGIYNLVRALTHPYVGAHHQWPDGTESKVWRVRREDSVPPDIEPGKVICSRDDTPLVKCGDGALWIEKHEMALNPHEGAYL